VSVSSFSFVNNALFNLTFYVLLMPYAMAANRAVSAALNTPQLGEHAATGSQNSDPSPQFLVGTQKNFVIDLADFGTQTEKGCPLLI